MRFIVTEGGRYNGCGDLFYSLPDKASEKYMEGMLRALCEQKGEITPEIEAELEVLQERGKTAETLIMYEIAQFSNILGYRTTLLGDEGGLYVMQRLGISGYYLDGVGDYGAIPSEMCVAEMKEKEDYTFDFLIAEPVRKYIPALLTKRLGDLGEPTALYRKITLIDSVDFEERRESPDSEIAFPKSPEAKLRLARNVACEKCDNLPFDEAEKYVFRDDVYRLLRSKGLEKAEAFRIAKGIIPEPRKKKDTETLRKLGLSEKVLRIIFGMGYRWSLASSMAKVYESGRYFEGGDSLDDLDEDELPF